MCCKASCHLPKPKNKFPFPREYLIFVPVNNCRISSCVSYKARRIWLIMEKLKPMSMSKKLSIELIAWDCIQMTTQCLYICFSQEAAIILSLGKNPEFVVVTWTFCLKAVSVVASIRIMVSISVLWNGFWTSFHFLGRSDIVSYVSGTKYSCQSQAFPVKVPARGISCVVFGRVRNLYCHLGYLDYTIGRWRWLEVLLKILVAVVLVVWFIPPTVICASITDSSVFLGSVYLDTDKHFIWLYWMPRREISKMLLHITIILVDCENKSTRINLISAAHL